jgi:hypothetical protein
MTAKPNAAAGLIDAAIDGRINASGGVVPVAH